MISGENVNKGHQKCVATARLRQTCHTTISLHLHSPDHFNAMSLSEHFPPSTQDVLSAQLTPPKRKRTIPADTSVISISSSPLQPPPYQQVLDSDDEQYFAPPRSPSRVSPALKPRKRPSFPHSDIEVLEDQEFTRLLDTFKCDTVVAPPPPPLREATNITRQNPKTKTNLDGFFQERKPVSQNRVKKTLKPRLSLPKPTKPKISAKQATNTTSETQTSSFLTTWAAEQAPIIRPTKASSKPRKKPTKKKKDVEVVLLSPETAQACVRKSLFGQVDVERRLGEKRDGGMWNVSNRGLAGELYDEQGGILFSQELRVEQRESSPDVPLQEVEVVDLGATPKAVREESSVILGDGDEQCIVDEVADTTTVVATMQDGLPARRRGPVGKVADNGMPLYSTYTLPQLQVPLSRLHMN